MRKPLFLSISVLLLAGSVDATDVAKDTGQILIAPAEYPLVTACCRRLRQHAYQWLDITLEASGRDAVRFIHATVLSRTMAIVMTACDAWAAYDGVAVRYGSAGAAPPGGGADVRTETAIAPRPTAPSSSSIPMTASGSVTNSGRRASTPTMPYRHPTPQASAPSRRPRSSNTAATTARTNWATRRTATASPTPITPATSQRMRPARSATRCAGCAFRSPTARAGRGRRVL
jgi:hypothetical protein